MYMCTCMYMYNVHCICVGRYKTHKHNNTCTCTCTYIHVYMYNVMYVHCTCTCTHTHTHPHTHTVHSDQVHDRRYTTERESEGARSRPVLCYHHGRGPREVSQHRRSLWPTERGRVATKRSQAAGGVCHNGR